MSVAIDARHLGDWTGSIFGSRSRDERAPATITDHSMLDGTLLGPGLRDLVPLWDEALTPTASDTLLDEDADSIVFRFAGTATSAPIRFLIVQQHQAISASEKAAEDLERIREALDLPIRDVTKAAGVPTRTYYSWRNSRKAVRLGANHRLADLQLSVEDLRDLLGDDLRSWIRQSRMVDLLRRGEFDELLHEASTWHARTHPMNDEPEWARPTADWVEDHPVSNAPPRVRRQATTRTATTRRKSQAREV